MTTRTIVIALMTLVLLGLAGSSEAASVFPFEGHGTVSGDAAPAPLTWFVVSGALWTLGGNWPSATAVTDFHITFTSRTLDVLDLFHDDSAGSVLWDEVITTEADGFSVDFFAPAGVSLDQGELFVIHILWNETGTAAVRDFTAHWTTDRVPEPASLLLLGAGLGALALARRRLS